MGCICFGGAAVGMAVSKLPSLERIFLLAHFCDGRNGFYRVGAFAVQAISDVADSHS